VSTGFYLNKTRWASGLVQVESNCVALHGTYVQGLGMKGVGFFVREATEKTQQ
jgi:hypothetical protein